MVDEQTFFAWLDGELPQAEAAEVERQVADDPKLRRLADEHRALASELRGAFGTVADAPVPAHLAAAVVSQRDAEVVNLSDARARRAAGSAPPVWKQAMAMAATLALGIVVGNQFAGDPASPIQPESGRLVAGAQLEQALYAQLASAPAEEGPRIGLTFRDRSGSICRTFEDGAAAGLACREGDDWRIRGLFQAPEGQGGDYRMAAGADPRLLEMVDASIAGEPLDAAQEQAVKERGWK